MDPTVQAVGSNFVWHEVYGPDAQVAIDFYTRALDFGVEHYDMGEMGNYPMLTKGGVPVCGVMGTANHPQMADVPPHWATYLAVDDLDARLARCQEHGATLVVPPIEVPNVGRMALITDPQGAHLWLYKPASQG
jgi:uncharacterized protein